jgi:hypothetical protein
MDSSSKSTNYTVGWLTIPLTDSLGDVQKADQMPEYAWNSSIRFAANQQISPDIDLALTKFQIETIVPKPDPLPAATDPKPMEAVEFKLVVASFSMNYYGNQPIPVPDLAVEIVSTDGRKYLGSRVETPVETMGPNLTYTVSYAFRVPASESGQNVVMVLSDPQSLAPFRLPIATLRTKFN